MYSIAISRPIGDKRVLLSPYHVKTLINAGNEVYFLDNVGIASGFDNSSFIEVGAMLCRSIEELFSKTSIIITPSLPDQTQLSFVNATHTIISFSYLYANELTARYLSDVGATVVALEEFRVKAKPVFFKNLAELISNITFSMLHKLTIDNNLVLLPSDTIIFLGYNLVTIDLSKKLSTLGVNCVFFDEDTSKSVTIHDFSELELFLPSATAVISLPSNKLSKSAIYLTTDQLLMLPQQSPIIDLAAFYGGSIEGLRDDAEPYRHNGRPVFSSSNIYSLSPSTWARVTSKKTLSIILKYLSSSSTMQENCMHLVAGEPHKDIQIIGNLDAIELDIEEINHKISTCLNL